eukprot:6490491-Amphidinium_carterae.1
MRRSNSSSGLTYKVDTEPAGATGGATGTLEDLVVVIFHFFALVRVKLTLEVLETGHSSDEPIKDSWRDFKQTDVERWTIPSHSQMTLETLVRQCLVCVEFCLACSVDDQ